MSQPLSNAALFGIGAGIGGVAAFGLGLWVKYVLIPNLFVAPVQQPTAANPQITNPPYVPQAQPAVSVTAGS